MKRQLDCECCGIAVTLSAERLRELVKSRRKPLCEQCRRYVMPGTARVAKVPGESQDMALWMRHKTGKGAKHKRGLESVPVKRCGGKGCDVAV